MFNGLLPCKEYIIAWRTNNASTCCLSSWIWSLTSIRQRMTFCHEIDQINLRRTLEPWNRRDTSQPFQVLWFIGLKFQGNACPSPGKAGICNLAFSNAGLSQSSTKLSRRMFVKGDSRNTSGGIRSITWMMSFGGVEVENGGINLEDERKRVMLLFSTVKKLLMTQLLWK